MQIEAINVPIAADEEGVLRVGNTRVTLDVIVAAFEQGSTPEEIGQDFPTLRLGDIYAVLTYYLQHRERIEVYLHKRRGEATELRREVETRFDVQGLRERLRARRSS